MTFTPYPDYDPCDGDDPHVPLSHCNPLTPDEAMLGDWPWVPEGLGVNASHGDRISAAAASASSGNTNPFSPKTGAI